MGLCILRDAAAGINYLHHAQPPIVHTMLEPRKIMLDANYRGQVVAMPLSEVGLHCMCATCGLMLLSEQPKAAKRAATCCLGALPVMFLVLESVSDLGL